MSIPGNKYILEDGVMTHDHIVVKELDFEELPTDLAKLIKFLQVIVANFVEGSDLTFEIEYDRYEPSRPEAKIGYWRPKTEEAIAKERARIEERQRRSSCLTEIREKATLAELLKKHGAPK